MNVCIIGSYLKALVMTSERIPAPGETLNGRDFRECYGGKGSDMAVQAARLGANVSFIGVVGDDNFGREFISLMEEEHVDTSGIRVAKEQETGVGLIVKDERARNVIVIDKGANNLFCESDIDANIGLIRKADVVLAQLEIPVETALYALKKAKELGKTTILNPAPAVDLMENKLDFVDIITPNETEAGIAAGENEKLQLSHDEAAKRLLGTGCKKVIMTLGGKGVSIYTPEKQVHVPAYKIKVVDSNGAGDCFNASLSVAIAEGRKLQDAVTFANATAGLCCTKWETVPSYHTRKEVLEFMEGYAV